VSPVNDVHPVTVELLAWIACRRRTYVEAMSAWTSNCPRQPAWDDAASDRLIEMRTGGEVVLTPRGRAVLEGRGA
jgi:hypothetical protein